MRRFRAKPVEIEAMHFTDSLDSGREIEAWSNGAVELVLSPHGNELHVRTLEGTMTAEPGDWIICGTQGEFYPCKPDAFDAKYEAA